MNRFQATRPRGARRVLHRERRYQRASFKPRAREGRDQQRDVAAAHGPARFQATRPRGARRRAVIGDGYAVNVSSHAPARGATDDVQVLHDEQRGFKPRAREGRDISIFAIGIFDINVSSHAPARGATDRDNLYTLRRSCFKPRAREGRDHL